MARGLEARREGDHMTYRQWARRSGRINVHAYVTAPMTAGQLRLLMLFTAVVEAAQKVGWEYPTVLGTLDTHGSNGVEPQSLDAPWQSLPDAVPLGDEPELREQLLVIRSQLQDLLDHWDEICSGFRQTPKRRRTRRAG